MKIGSSLFNSLAYADDIEVLAANSQDLQKLVDICYAYSIKWRFAFGTVKSKCIVVGNRACTDMPRIYLGDNVLKCVESINVLGRTFTRDGLSTSHITTRIQNSRRAMYSVGYNNEELLPTVKAHIWKTVGLPTMLYAVATGPVSAKEIKCLESFQGSIMKSGLYLHKFSHHSDLLKALNISKISDVISQQRVNLFRRAFKVITPYSKLCIELMAKYFSCGKVVYDTLIGRVINMGLSPTLVAFSDVSPKLESSSVPNGVCDSLRFILNGHIRPGNELHEMLKNLTKSF